MYYLNKMSNVPETTTISVDKKDVELIETTTPLKKNNELKELKDTKKNKKFNKFLLFLMIQQFLK